jgi:hypothetical protein
MRPAFAVLLIGILSFFLLESCTDKYEPTTMVDAGQGESGCVYCHLNKDLLKQVADPIEQGGGEAGEG